MAAEMVNVEIEGQVVQIEKSVAENDETLKRVLAPIWPGAANSTVDRTKDPIRIIKRAGTKGAGTDVIVDALLNSEEGMNPLLAFYERLEGLNLTKLSVDERDQLGKDATKALNEGEDDRQLFGKVFGRLVDTQPMPGDSVPEGF